MKECSVCNQCNAAVMMYHCRLLYGDQARYFEQELKPRIKHSKLGQISMVNNGSNMHGSQVANPSVKYTVIVL